MGDVTALMMDVITEKSGHTVTPMAVSVCLTPAAPAPLPLPYPVVGSSIEGIGDGPLRTKINGAVLATVGSVLKTCHGNEPGTLKEVVSLNTAGPCFIVMGAPVVLCELGMMGITGSMCMQNKAPTPGASGSASDAGGTGGAGGGGGEGSGSGGDGHGPGGPAGGGGAGGGGSNSGASGPGSSSAPADAHTCQNGHPVNVVTGHVVDQAIDLQLPGVIPLVWKRYYSSARRQDATASLGPGWAHGFEQRITDDERTLTLREGEGRLVYFARVAPGETTFHRKERLSLTRGDDGSYRVWSAAARLTHVFAADRPGAPALLREIRDPYDNLVRLEYDDQRLVRVHDTAGRTVHLAWKHGRITRLEVRVNDRLEQWVDYAYSGAGCLSAVIDAQGGAEEYEYDRFHRMIAAGLKNQSVFRYEYEANTGRCSKTWGPNGLYAIELVADAAAHTTEVLGEEPRIYAWNDQGLMTRESVPGGAVIEERAYDEDGFLIAEVNGAGEGTQYWFDARGNPIRTVGPTGNVTITEYDDNDLPTRRITPDQLVTTFTHDAKGALTGVAYPSGRVCSLSYDARGRLTAIHDGDGLARGFEYDAQHNSVAETDARGARFLYDYDGMGRPIAFTDALGRTTRIAYDRLGRRISARYPDGTTRQSGYDAMGKLIRDVDALGRVTQMEYAGMGVLTRLVEPGGRAWSFKYTSTERLAEIKNPRGEQYAFTYDDAGRVIEETTFDGRTHQYRWSDAGRLARIDYADRSWRAFSRDRLGNVIGEEASDQSTLAFQRDRMGRMLAAMIEEGGQRITTLFERDALGRVVTERQGDRAIRYELDARGRRTRRVMPDGATTRYAYDRGDGLIGVDHNGYLLAIERDAVGREIQRGRAGGLSIHRSYDEMNRLVEQRATAPTPGDGIPDVLAQRQWSYDRTGRVTRIDDARFGATSYRYDTLGRLLEATRGTHREVFGYDQAAALVQALSGLEASSARGAASAWTIAPGNQLQRTDKARYTHDRRGRRTGQIDLGSESPTRGQITEYRWDCRDRLREVTLPGGGRVEMTYDAFGRRVRKEVFSSDSAAARVVEFVWDGDALAADLDSERGSRCFVVEPGTQIQVLQEERGEVLACVNDHLGAPRELIDPGGKVAWAAAASAWGKIVETHADPASEAHRGRKVSSPFRLLGQYEDEETGLRATRFRYFDPEVGRWCSADPLGIDGGLDLYGFEGSPTHETDPLGLTTGTPHPPGVNTDHVPTGSYDQPNGGRTDIRQAEDHGAGVTHTHDPIINTAPDGRTFQNGRQQPGRPVSQEDVDNIMSGRAPRSRSKGR
jgi:RHS repeat-associated protein